MNVNQISSTVRILAEIKEELLKKKRITQSEYDAFKVDIDNSITVLANISSTLDINNVNDSEYKQLDKLKNRCYTCLDKIHFRLKGYSLGIK